MNYEYLGGGVMDVFACYECDVISKTLFVQRFCQGYGFEINY
jgi:hypothetical protein